MKEEHCTRCHPLPKPLRLPERTIKSARRDRHVTARATNEFLIDDALRDDLCDHSSDPETMRRLLMADDLLLYHHRGSLHCIFYHPGIGTTWERNILVRLIDGTQTLTSAPRAAYAATAVRREPLYEGQNAVHLCRSEIRGEIRQCCINPLHIVGQ